MIVGGRGVSITAPIEEIKVNIGQSSKHGDAIPIENGLGQDNYYATYHGKIIGWKITGHPSGSIIIDILKAFERIPTASDTISGSEPPTLSSSELNSDMTLNTWTDIHIEPGDVLGVNILSCTDVEHVVLTIQVMQN